MTLTLKAKVTKNTKGLERLKKQFDTINQTGTVQVGWFPESKYRNGTSVAYVAWLNELGHYTNGKYKGYSPPRPFFRTFLVSYMSEPTFKNFVGHRLQLVLKRELTTRQMYKQIAEHLMERVRQEMVDKTSPANKALTISLKGFDDPLIDTGKMYDTLKYKIVKIKA